MVCPATTVVVSGIVVVDEDAPHVDRLPVADGTVVVSALRVAAGPTEAAVGLTAVANSLTVLAHVLHAAIVDIGASGFQLFTASISAPSHADKASIDERVDFAIQDALLAFIS